MLRRITARPIRIRVPALSNGVMTFSDLEKLRGQWTILCCIPSLDPMDAIFLDHQYEIFSQYGAALVVLCRHDRLLLNSRIAQLRPLRIPILADPLGRLSRAYSTSNPQGWFRCHISLLDHQLILQSQISHDLDIRSMDEILELLAVLQEREHPEPNGYMHYTTPQLSRL